jgi:hypothetical protein
MMPQARDFDIGVARRLAELEKKLARFESYPSGPSIAELYADFRGLPALRGLWYPGAADNTGAVYDASGQGRTLTYNGGPRIFTDLYASAGQDVVPHYYHDGTGDWFSRASEAGLGLVGNEAYVDTALQGASVFGWFYIHAVQVNKFIAKQDAATAAGNNYVLYTDVTAHPSFQVASGATTYTVSAADAIAINTWHFLVGRFVPLTSVSIIVDGVETANTTAIPATLNNPVQPFQIGAGNNTNPLNGGWALAGICACALPDELIQYLFSRTQSLFGS